jgi:uncharacterized membrane protein YeiH
MGTITGSAGGVVRDVLCAEIPQLLRRGNLYASAAILGISVYFTLAAAGVSHAVANLVGLVVVAAVRLAAITFRLQLPVFALEGDGVPARRNRTSRPGSP